MPKKNELPSDVWNFLTTRVPESQRAMAAMELMRILERTNWHAIRAASTDAASKMMHKMRYRRWRVWLGGFGVGFIVAGAICALCYPALHNFIHSFLS